MKFSAVSNLVGALFLLIANHSFAQEANIDISFDKSALDSPTWVFDFSKEQEKKEVPSVTFTNGIKIKVQESKESRQEIVSYLPSGRKGASYGMDSLRIIRAYPDDKNASLAIVEKSCIGSACMASSYVVYYIRDGKLRGVHLDRQESAPAGEPFDVDKLSVVINDDNVKSLCAEGIIDGEDTDEVGDLIKTTKCISPQDKLIDINVKQEYEPYVNVDLIDLVNDKNLRQPILDALGAPTFKLIRDEFLKGKLFSGGSFEDGRFIMKSVESYINSTKLFFVMDATDGDFFFLGINEDANKMLFRSNIADVKWTSKGFNTWREILQRWMSGQDTRYSIKLEGDKFVVMREG